MKDHSREVVVKFSCGKITEGDKDKIKMFISMIGKSSTKNSDKEPVKSNDDLKVVGGTKKK